MSAFMRMIGYGCVLVCVALLAVGVFVFYLIRSVIDKKEEENEQG